MGASAKAAMGHGGSVRAADGPPGHRLGGPGEGPVYAGAGPVSRTRMKIMRTLATGLAVNRVLFGLGFLAAPDKAVPPWLGRKATRNEASRILAQSFGARDVALGLGALEALSNGRGSARTWFAGHAIADGADFVETLMAKDLPRRGRLIGLALAGGSALIGAAYAALADRASKPRAAV